MPKKASLETILTGLIGDWFTIEMSRHLLQVDFGSQLKIIEGFFSPITDAHNRSPGG